MNNHNVHWAEFLSHWPLWSVYIAHFSMNWSNYIIMQWLPTYMARNLGAEKHDIMFTAVPYLLNSLVGVGRCTCFVTSQCSNTKRTKAMEKFFICIDADANKRITQTLPFLSCRSGRSPGRCSDCQQMDSVVSSEVDDQHWAIGTGNFLVVLQCCK